MLSLIANNGARAGFGVPFVSAPSGGPICRHKAQFSFILSRRIAIALTERWQVQELWIRHDCLTRSSIPYNYPSGYSRFESCMVWLSCNNFAIFPGSLLHRQEQARPTIRLPHFLIVLGSTTRNHVLSRLLLWLAALHE